METRVAVISIIVESGAVTESLNELLSSASKYIIAYDAFFPLIAVALIYLTVVVFLSWLLGCLEKRLKRNE